MMLKLIGIFLLIFLSAFSLEETNPRYIRLASFRSDALGCDGARVKFADSEYAWFVNQDLGTLYKYLGNPNRAISGQGLSDVTYYFAGVYCPWIGQVKYNDSLLYEAAETGITFFVKNDSVVDYETWIQ